MRSHTQPQQYRKNPLLERARLVTKARKREQDTELVQWLFDQPLPGKRRIPKAAYAEALDVGASLLGSVLAGTQVASLPDRVVVRIEQTRRDEMELLAFLATLRAPKKKTGRPKGTSNAHPMIKTRDVETIRVLNTPILRQFITRWGMNQTQCAKALSTESSTISNLLNNHMGRYPSDLFLESARMFSGCRTGSDFYDTYRKAGYGYPLSEMKTQLRLDPRDVLPYVEWDAPGAMDQWVLRSWRHYDRDACVFMVGRHGPVLDFVLAAARAENVWFSDEYATMWPLERSALYYKLRLKAEAILLPYVPEGRETWRWNASGLDIAATQPEPEEFYADPCDRVYLGPIDVFAWDPDMVE